MDPASATSETAKMVLEPFLGLERLSSRRDLRCSLTMPSDISFMFSRASAALLILE